MSAVLVSYVIGVRQHPDADRLTIVSVFNKNGVLPHEVVANLQDDGTPRWRADELCAYVPVNAIVPEDVLKERGYWEEGAKKGMLGASKGNRVTPRKFADYPSLGLIFKIDTTDDGSHNDVFVIRRGTESKMVEIGDDVTEFLGVTTYVPQ